jgi:hypothetical protein
MKSELSLEECIQLCKDGKGRITQYKQATSLGDKVEIKDLVFQLDEQQVGFSNVVVEAQSLVSLL